MDELAEKPDRHESTVDARSQAYRISTIPERNKLAAYPQRNRDTANPQWELTVESGRSFSGLVVPGLLE